MGPLPDPDRLRTVGLLLVPGVAAVYLAFRGGGTAAAALAVVAVACLAVLLGRARPGTVDARLVTRASEGAILALPGALTAYFAFNAGGFFPEEPAFVAIVLILILVVRLTTAEDPLAGFSWPLALAAAALGLLCVWTLVSGGWSDAPARALIDFDRAFVYLLALVLFGSIPRTARALRWMVRGVALAIVIVVVAAFLTRTLPEVFTSEPGLSKRLGWPLTYWNALGIFGSLGAVLCLHLAASLREHVVVRVLATAAIPVVGATVLLTFSRGAILAGIGGLVLYVLVGRPRGFLTALVAAVPLGAIAVKVAYDATLISGDDQRSPAAIDEGQEVALLVAACCVGAGLIRLLLIPVDRRLLRLRIPERLRQPRVRRGAVAGAAALTLVVVLAAGVPGRIADQYDRFVDNPEIEAGQETRERLTDPANTGRVDHWNVALDVFGDQPLRGAGAGTYGTDWMADRPADNPLVVDDAHSLYFETLAELGLVGIVLLTAVLGAILAAFVPWRRGDNRPVYGALLAAGATWTVHAGIDWDWEMPAVTIWFFCLGGAALAARPGARRPSLPGGTRVTLGVLLLAGAIAPALLLVSQRRLDDAVAAFERGDCQAATDRARASIRALENRPDPYEVLALCDVRQGFDRLGVAAMERAVERDPDNWEYLYGLAIVRGSAGVDPRAAATRALELNPNDELTKSLVRYVDTSDPQLWIRRLRPIAENERLSVVD